MIEWPEETQPKLDQQDARFQSDRTQAVASALAGTLDEASRAELAQVVPKLAEAVLITREVFDHRVLRVRRGIAREFVAERSG